MTPPKIVHASEGSALAQAMDAIRADLRSGEEVGLVQVMDDDTVGAAVMPLSQAIALAAELGARRIAAELQRAAPLGLVRVLLIEKGTVTISTMPFVGETNTRGGSA